MGSRSLIASLVCSLLAVAAGVPPAAAQQYPTKPVRVLVGFAPGGGIDIMARVFSQQLTDRLEKNFLVENRVGASGNLASAVVAKAAPDGHTLLMIPIAYVINPAFGIPADFDPIADFQPVTMVASAPNVIIVPPSLPATTLKEFIAYAKTVPQKLNYSTSGAGSSTHLAALLFSQLTGLDMVHVPYSGGGRAVAAVVAGDVGFNVASMPAAIGLIRSGQVKALATTGATRAGVAPELPTAHEAGLAYEYTGWYGMLAPKGTPRPVVDKLRAEILESLKTQFVLERLAADGAEPVGSTPEEFGAFLAAQIETWKKVVRDSGVKTK